MDQNTHDQQQRLSSAGLTEDIRGVMTDIERRLDRLRAAHADREREREELEARSAEVDRRAEELETAAVELGERRREHEEAVAAAERRFAELDQREVQAREAFEQAKARHDAQRREIAEQRERIDADRQDFDAQRQAFEAEREQSRQIAEEAAQQLRDLEDDRAALEATARELDERQRDLDEQATALAEKLRELDGRQRALDARAAQLEQQDRKLADLSRKAAEAQEKLSGDNSDLQQQKQWLAEQTRQADLLRARVKQLQNELEHARAQAAEAAKSPASPAEPDQALVHELDVTRAKLRDAAGIIADLRNNQHKATPSQPAPTGDEHLQRRQRRLRYVRQTLQQERSKIAKASELLRQRSAALAQQATSGQPAEPERRASAPNGPLASIARLGVGMACVAGAIVVLAGVSWIAAGEVAASTYAASVTVGHDARGRQPLAEDLAGWQAFHESLMSDPRFYEFAAERMRQRGMLGLGDAVSVKSFVQESVAWQSGRDGELTIEVRERGADRARRVAETLALALIGQANTARERRPDGLPSVVAKEAATNARPLTNERPMYAGGFFVGLLAVSAGLGGLVSKRVAKVREQAASEGHTDMDDMGEQHEGRISIG